MNLSFSNTPKMRRFKSLGRRSKKSRLTLYSVIMILITVSLLTFGILRVALSNKCLDYGREIRVLMKESVAVKNELRELENKKAALYSDRSIISLAESMGMKQAVIKQKYLKIYLKPDEMRRKP